MPLPRLKQIELLPGPDVGPICLKDRLCGAATPIDGGKEVVGHGLNGVDAMVGLAQNTA